MVSINFAANSVYQCTRPALIDGINQNGSYFTVISEPDSGLPPIGTPVPPPSIQYSPKEPREDSYDPCTAETQTMSSSTGLYPTGGVIPTFTGSTGTTQGSSQTSSGPIYTNTQATGTPTGATNEEGKYLRNL